MTIYVQSCVVSMMPFLLQLKLYAQRKSINPKIDDSYSAKAGNEYTWREILKGDKRIAEIIICAQIFIVVFAIVVAALLTIVCLLPKRFGQKGISDSDACKKLSRTFNTDDNAAIIFSAAILSIIATFYIVALDSAAIEIRNEEKDTELRMIHAASNSAGKSYKILYNLPDVVLVFDILFAFLCGLLVIVCLVRFIWLKCSDDDSDGVSQNDVTFSFLSISIFFPLFSILMHSPYIAIAFLNDAYHAGSMFLYYSIVTFSLFVINEIIYKSFMKCKSAQVSSENNLEYKCECNRKNPYLIFILLAIVVLFFFGTIATVTCYFVLIPINKSISDAPNRLIGLYQSCLVLVAAFVIYKTFLKKKRPAINKALKECEEPFNNIARGKWNLMSEEERHVSFYSHILDIVQKYSQQPTGQGQTPATRAADQGQPPATGAADQGQPPASRAVDQGQPPATGAVDQGQPLATGAVDQGQTSATRATHTNTA